MWRRLISGLSFSVVCLFSHSALASVSTPTGVNATPVSSSEIDLSWNASTTSSGSIKNYKIYRNGVSLVSVPGTQLSYKNTGLAASTAYSYQIQAYNSSNRHSALSASVSATTMAAAAPPPPTFTVTPSGSNVAFNPSTPQSVMSGATQSFNLAANSGYALSSIVLGTCPFGGWSGTTYTTGAINLDCSVSFSASPMGAAFTGTLLSSTPSSVQAGSTESINVSVQSLVAAPSILIDVEVYDSANNKMGQGYFDNQSFSPGQTLSYNYDFATANLPAGSYSVQLGVFNAGWGPLILWTTLGYFQITTTAPTTYTVTPSGTNVTITPNVAQTVNAGATSSFTVTANTGNTLSAVAGTCTPGTWNGNVYTTGAINSACSVLFSASASTQAPTVTLSANPASITSGQSSTLIYSSTNATSCTGTNFTASGTSGSVAVNPTVTTQFSISCTGSGGTTVASTTVFLGGSTTSIIPSNRITLWQPGVTYNGGIPTNRTVYVTLSPLGSGQDDTPQIQNALNNCPPNGIVKLTAGVFNITGNGLAFTTSNCTLRGAGPGQGLSTGINGVGSSAGKFTVDSTATQLWKSDHATNPSYGILYVGNSGGGFSSSTNLASDAQLGSQSMTLVSNPGLQVGEIVYIDMNTDNDPDVVWGPSFGPPGDGSRRWFSRQDRSLSQMMEVTSVNGNTITFATPFHISFTVANQAQLTRYAQPVSHGIGVEDIFFFGGMGGDYHGNIPVVGCAYCWVKHVEAMWSVGTGIGFYQTYRSELRDSYIHETPDANPGGGGYLTGLNYGASDNLFENNIMWYGNKVDVMRGTGGGNVLAYNYTDDSFGSNYPESPEAGINAGHFTTPHMELIEGNYSPNFKGDTYWGNSIYITVFRNWFSGSRAAHAPLNTYVYSSLTGGGTTCNFPYMDITGREAVDVQAYSFYHNFVGNVLGKSGQVLLSYPQALQTSCYDGTEDEFLVEDLNNDNDPDPFVMWRMGAYQASVNSTGSWTWLNDTISSQLRQGNFDWVTGAQTWYASPIGAFGPGNGAAVAIPNSMYLNSKPAFFGSNPWPWVNPSTGATSTFPAKARFDAGTPNAL
jgi:hypothetical protein